MPGQGQATTRGHLDGDDNVGDIGASCANCESDFEGFHGRGSQILPR